jgi:hypothetical protein
MLTTAAIWSRLALQQLLQLRQHGLDKRQRQQLEQVMQQSTMTRSMTGVTQLPLTPCMDMRLLLLLPLAAATGRVLQCITQRAAAAAAFRSRCMCCVSAWLHSKWWSRALHLQSWSMLMQQVSGGLLPKHVGR